MKLALNLPINNVSFGQVSLLLLKTIYEQEKAGTRTLDFCLFPIAQADLSAEKPDEEFTRWLQSKINVGFEIYNRDVPVFKLWHLNGSLESYGRNQTLLSFYELDNPTKVELNIARNNKLCFSSKYSCDVFKIFGVDTQYLPLAFDSYNFQKLDKQYQTDGRIVFNLCGKLEKRKHHAKVIQAWVQKFGKNPKYALQCATYNPFFAANQKDCDKINNDAIRQVLKGEKPFNVSFYPLMRENSTYNDFLNSANIIIGMSGGEGWGLPEFHSVGMGKHAVILNAHGYKTWVDDKMATLVQPTGKIPSADNMFFREGDVFNQGQIFDWDVDAFIAACETAIAKVEANPVNTAGLTLQQTFSKEKFVDNVITQTCGSPV